MSQILPQPSNLPRSWPTVFAATLVATAGFIAGCEDENESAVEEHNYQVDHVIHVSLDHLKACMPEDGNILGGPGTNRMSPKGVQQVGVPRGWSPSSSSSPSWVCAFNQGQSQLPRIIVTAELSSYRTAKTLSSEADMKQFVPWLAGIAQSERGTQTERVEPVMIHGRPFGRYTYRARAKIGLDIVPIEHQKLVTIHNGRMFTIDLNVATQGKDFQDPNNLGRRNILRHRNCSYAVAATMEFARPTGNTGDPADGNAINGNTFDGSAAAVKAPSGG